MTCPICNKPTKFFGTVDLNRDCLGLSSLSGENFTEYHICTQCKFTFAPTMYLWTDKEFSTRIYNEEYIKVDPEFKDDRPNRVSKDLISAFPTCASIRHLDYGGGSGTLSRILKLNNWTSTYYDPFFMECIYHTNKQGYKYNLITAIEVFEHTKDPQKLMKDISSMLSSSGLLILTTLLSDRNLSINWNYIAPRNGHISIFSQQSLRLLAKQYNLNFISLSENIHVMWKKVPKWAEHLNLAA